ncbi:MAG: hypothetical protein HY685_01105 [Chloroflexi bacterium]|nr:hypothetical protein [Chloroflexota bacterium]
MRRWGNGRIYGLGVMVVIGLLALGACSSGISQEEVDAKDSEIANLQSQVSQLRGQVGGLEQDSKYWAQLTSLVVPVDPAMMPNMSDHRVFMLPTGAVIGLHFDNMDLKQAKNLNWVAFGVPGVFCKDDQARVEAQFGPGFTHFHDMMNDVHGGAPGTAGAWFVHTAVRDFQAPWGPVSQGIDYNFMPTAAPSCS